MNEIKEIVKQKLEAYDGNSVFVSHAFAEYIEKGYMRSKNKDETVKYTVF